MQIEKRVEQLEHQLNRAGCCTHLPPLVLSSGEPPSDRLTCHCGRERLIIQIQEVRACGINATS
jgi:hypothetical protein